MNVNIYGRITNENVKNIKSKLSSLTVINIRESVIEIGDNTFKENCNGIKKVTIGESVTKIGKEAFFTYNLEELVIGNSVQTIGNDAFTGIKQDSNVYYCGIQSLNSIHFLPSQSSLRIHIPSYISTWSIWET